MKTSKKIFSLALALVMSLGMAFSFTLKASATGPSTPTGDNGTITITNAAKGETYTAYQVFGATYDATDDATAWTISTTSKWYTAVASAADTPFTLYGTDANFKYVTTKTGVADSTVIQWLQDHTPADADVQTSVEATGSNLVLNVPYGYYLIKSTTGTGAAVTINQVNPSKEVIDKNTTTPTVPGDFKKVWDASTQTWEASTTAKVGDTVKYQVEMNTVNWVTTVVDGKTVTVPVTNYTVEDTPTDIEIDVNSVKVFVGETEIVNTETDTKFTAEIENGKLIVKVKWANVEGEGEEKKVTSLYPNDSVVKVTYNAEVLESAVIPKAEDGKTWSNNHASVFWNETENFGDDTDTKVYNFKFDILKYDAAVKDKTATLEGAKFELYASETGTDKINLVKEGTYYRVAKPEEYGVEGFASAVPKSDENGFFEIRGLANGTYWLEETDAPDGFNKMQGRMSVVINGDDKTGSAVVEVPNSKGTELPSTGGMGTTIFYTVGGILVVGAAVLLITKKRMDGAQ